METFVRL